MEESEPFFSRNNNGAVIQLSSLDQINEIDEKSQIGSYQNEFSRESSTSSSCPSYVLAQRKSYRKHDDFSDQDSFIDETSFCQDFHSPHEIETVPSSNDIKNPQNEDLIVFENPNPDFEVWDFHPNEIDPSTFTYSTHLENLRLSMNTFLKKPVKQAFSINTKKAMVSVTKGESKTIDQYTDDTSQHEFDTILQQEYSKFASGRHMTRRKNYQLQQSQIVPFYKTKKFRKITNVYYYVDPDNPGLTVSNYKVKDKKGKRYNQGVSPRKTLAGYHNKASKKRSTMILKQSSNQLSISNVVQSILVSPLVKQGLKIQNQMISRIKPTTSEMSSPESNTKMMSHSQKPMTNDRIMTRRISGGLIRNTSPESLDSQIARYKFKEKKLEKQSQQQVQYMMSAQYMHITKRNTTSNDAEGQQPPSQISKINKQFPMIRFDNPQMSIKVESSMQNQITKDQKILDMLTNLYSKNPVSQIEKCQLQSHYYSKRMSDMSVTHKQAMADKIENERNSLMQSRMSQKDIKEEANFINNKTFTNFQTLYKKDQGILQQGKAICNINAMSLPQIQNSLQSVTVQKDANYQSQRHGQESKNNRNHQDNLCLPSSTSRRNHFLKQ